MTPAKKGGSGGGGSIVVAASASAFQYKGANPINNNDCEFPLNTHFT